MGEPRDGSPLTSQQGNENNNMAEDDPIFQGEFVKLSESRRLFIGSKSDSWKPKHIVLRRKGEKPILEYHKKKQKNLKKGEKTLTHSFELWPTFKVEKLTNARGRQFVCEITAPDIHQFVSSDLETDIDIFVFLLQSQIRLKENLREDIVSVIPDDSQAQIKIGAKGSKCFLHISPWGITLALARSRALLAQWPLKSIRYYETSGSGHFTIEAGRVAPMGEGVFGFQTATGEDDKTYDLVDNYIVNTLDRVKPSQRGTQEEIEDYIREHDFLHSLTMVQARARTDQEIKNVLRHCWSIGRGPEEQLEAADLEPSPALQTPSSPTATQTTRLNVSLERSISTGQGSSNTFPADARSSKRPPLVSNDSRTNPPTSGRSSSPDGRPPLPGRAAKRSRRRDHSLPRKIDVVAQSHPQQLSSSPPDVSSENVASPTETHPQHPRVSGRSRTPELPSKRSHHNTSSSSSNHPDAVHSPRRHSNPSNVVHSVNNTANLPPLTIQPYQNQPLDNSDTHHHHHTEFYNLHSPNLKVRVSKSPIVTRHPNKVGRAEYLLSMTDSGVRSPTSPEPGKKNSGKWDVASSPSNFSSDDENLETKKYMEAVARASQKKYGGHNSLDRTWVKGMRDGIGGDRASLGVDSLLHSESRSSSGYVNASKVSGGYVNLSNSNSTGNSPEKKLQDRQSSVESFTSALSRQSSVKNNPSSPPPPIHHHRQRSAPVDTDFIEASGYQVSPLLRKKGGITAGSSHEDSGVSLRSRSSQLSSDDGLSRDSAHSIGSFKSAVSRQPSGFSTLDSTGNEEEPSSVTNWLMSASCEDLSDHMRHVIFQDDDEEQGGKGGRARKNGEENESTYEEIRNTEEEGGDLPGNTNATSAMSDDKPPLPFTGLKKFQNNAANGYGSRDRSKSFGYMNMPQPVSKDNSALPVKQQSTAPSAHLIRKMVSARAKQDTLRKSLSNPNFLNLGSKEQLFKLKINSRNNMNSSSGNLSTSGGEKLSSGTKQKSRSFGNLFPAIKKALSRESIGNSHSRSTTPERRSSFRRSSFSLRRKSTDNEVGLRRQNSLHVPGEMTIKGIRMTARSRSFRRVRQTKSVDGLYNTDNDFDDNKDDTTNHDTNDEETDPTATYAVIQKSPASPQKKSSSKNPPTSLDSSPLQTPSGISRNSSNLQQHQAPNKADSSTNRQSITSTRIPTSPSNSSIKTLPNNKSHKTELQPSSTASLDRNSKTKSNSNQTSSSASSSPRQRHMRTSAANSSLKTPSTSPKKSSRNFSNSLQSSTMSADSSSSSLVMQNSNTGNASKSSSSLINNPASYSANLSITLSSPQNAWSSPPVSVVSVLPECSSSISNSPSTISLPSSLSLTSSSSSQSTQPRLPPMQSTTTTTTTNVIPTTPPSPPSFDAPPPPPPPPLPPRRTSATSNSTVTTKFSNTSVVSSSSSSSSSSSYSNTTHQKSGHTKENTKYNSNKNKNSKPAESTGFPTNTPSNYINTGGLNKNNLNKNTNANSNSLNRNANRGPSHHQPHQKDDNGNSSTSASSSSFQQIRSSFNQNPASASASHLTNGESSISNKSSRQRLDKVVPKSSC